MYKKFLLLVLSFSTVVHGMEQEKSSKWKSIKSKIKKKIHRQKEYEPETISAIKIERENFRRCLAFAADIIIYNVIMDLPRGYFFDMNKPTPFNFLQYVFYEKTHESAPQDLYTRLDKDPDFLDACQNCLIDGYSALGAAVISFTKASETKCKNQNEKRSLILESKRNQIRRLIERGFKPTPKDLELSYLELYERTKEDSHCKLMLLLLTEKYEERREPGLPSLSFDIVKKIAGYMPPSEEPLLCFINENN